MSSRTYKAKKILIDVPEEIKVKIDMEVNERVGNGKALVIIKGKRNISISVKSDSSGLLAVSCSEKKSRRVSLKKARSAAAPKDDVLTGSQRPKRRRPRTHFTEVTYSFPVADRRPFSCTITIQVPPAGTFFALQT